MIGLTWDDIITPAEKQIYAKAGYGKKMAWGSKPAVINVDVFYSSVGDKPEPILKSMERFPSSCGEEGWKGIHNIRRLLDVARETRIPIFYSARDLAGWRQGGWGEKTTDFKPDFGSEIVREVAPKEGELVIRKLKPSIFFGTPLICHLTEMKVDTVIMTGETTSGCVRASVIDAFSYNFKVIIPEECVYDRGVTSHKVNLFDMNQKYGDVVPLARVEEYLRNLRIAPQVSRT